MTTAPLPDDDPLCDGDPLARALAKLRPAPAGVEMNRLLFEAGQAARERAVAFWRRAFLITALALVAFGCLATVHLVRLDQLDQAAAPPVVRERIVYVERPAPGPTVPELAPPPRPAAEPAYWSGGAFVRAESDRGSLAEYLRLRHEVLTAGLGLLPDTGPRPTRPVDPGELEKSLHLPPGVLAAPYRPKP